MTTHTDRNAARRVGALVDHIDGRPILPTAFDDAAPLRR